jgi:outer membrane receptor protein involved in Fe transport
MHRHGTKLRVCLLATSAACAVMAGGGAWAQEVQPISAPADSLEEVVVTATRQTDTVNRVPLSVTAQTQKNLDQQGIRAITDLVATVPGLQVNQQLGSGVGNFALRGIVQSSAGAATTGFYLDDTPLQKRNVAGGVATANGTPVPPLFDLDRIEVLRGPQGTLYGGSSEGGTIRYIQPQPSLTSFSEYGKIQGSVPKSGASSGEVGLAVGGPIVKDKLGFRVSGYRKHQGGFIDMVDPIANQVWKSNTGKDDISELRAAITWAPTEAARITASYFNSWDKTDNVNWSYTLPTGAVTVPTLCFNPAAYTAATPPPGGVPAVVGRGDAACATAKAANPNVYTLPGATYGPFNLSRYQTLANDISPSKTVIRVANITADYDFKAFAAKLITSYFEDVNQTSTAETSQLGRYQSNANSANPTTTIADPLTGATRTVLQGPNFNKVFAGVPVRDQGGHFVAKNRRYGFTEELRLQSPGSAKPFSWVAGLFYSNIRNPQRYDNYYNLERLSGGLYGLTPQQRYGVRGLESTPGVFNVFDARRQSMKDVEKAAFAEANYWITSRLRATAGLRISEVSFTYANLFIGPVTGVGADNPNPALQTPNATNGGANSGKVSEKPVTPKFSLQYNVTDTDLVYVTASKGFRAGGINPLPAVGICGQALAVYGLTPTDLPQTYDSDSVWSYELGAKGRFLSNRLQVNGSVYRIDWQNPQVTLSPGFNCGLVSTYNAKSARSQGFELESQALLFPGFTANLAMGYNDSKYTATTIGVVGKTGTNLVVAVDGQKQPLAPYTISLGGRYEHEVASGFQMYGRVDWRFSATYKTTVFGIGQFAPDVNRVPAIQNTNIRIGVEHDDLDVSLFVNNLFDRKAGPYTGGRGGCASAATGGTAACTTYATYTPFYQLNTGYPREVGVQVVFRH